MSAIDLAGVSMTVSATAENGVVGSGTRLDFQQKGARVFARYAGGSIARGCLVGRMAGSTLSFRYAQREADGGLQAGRSTCEVLRLADGRIRIVEHFTWTTRIGSGVNVFDQLPA
jgi:hypothetical protein